MAARATLRRKVDGDAGGVTAVARALPEWFNREGQERIAREVHEQAGWVGVAGQSVVGFALWVRREGDAAELTWMGVLPDRHRGGLGTRLLEAVCEDWAANGGSHLDVSTVADSDPYEPYARTRAFYRARGFVDLRVDPGFYGTGAARYDRLVLRRAV
jgi:ribosomal protein S18 acetylase RimI-like enzyme